jgi:cyclophilin family peptidyl-prolyl cis-trans isomerase
MKKYFAFLLLMLPLAMTEAKPTNPENTLTIELKDGNVVIELYPDVAPKHVERIKKLVNQGKYDGVVFHRVIDGFMAQTGDVEFGNKKDFNSGRVGTGGSDLPDLKEEFNDKKHVRGTCSMARSSSPNSANSQFFICFEEASFLDGQYTVWGQVIEGMDHVDKIKKGSSSNNGSVSNPDHMVKLSVGEKSDSSKKSEEKK